MIQFEWDENKNINNQKKHGISFEEAAYVFSDRENISIPDIEHSEKEDRWENSMCRKKKFYYLYI
jgi:uncharacterized DUF497 family protein